MINQTISSIVLKLKDGQARQIGISVKWKQNSPEPKLQSLTVNGIPYTCSNGGSEELAAVGKPNH